MDTPAPIRYTVRLDAPNEHLLEVTLAFALGPSQRARLILPAWSPGSYLIREYARHVRHVHAEGGSGKPLPCRKHDKHSFLVEGDASGEAKFRYVLYAHDRSSRTNFVDANEAFLHGPATFFYVEGRAGEALTVDVDLPKTWRVATSLIGSSAQAALPSGTATAERRATVAAPTRLRAACYDDLADAPILAGSSLEEISFDACGRPHHIVVSGTCDGRLGLDQLAADVGAIIAEASKVFGHIGTSRTQKIGSYGGDDAALPYREYHFLLRLAAGAVFGGLEHKDSSALVASPYALGTHGEGPLARQQREKYQDLLELFSHEHFHAWNGKRIRPASLGPFDYEREAYTRSLWVVEGVTSYYDRLLLVRAGRLSPTRYLDKLGEDLERLAHTPGALVQSLEDSSFDAWIKFYRPDENTPNQTVSYYLLGSLVALLLDLEIRRRSEDKAGAARSIDDVMRHLWRHQQSTPTRGYPDDEVEALFAASVGLDLGDIFAAHVRGRAPLPIVEVLRTFGVACSPQLGPGASETGAANRAAAPSSGRADQGRQPPTLGIETRDGPGGRTVVRHVYSGGAGGRAGLSAGDEIVALDGFRVDERLLGERLERRRPGDRVRLTYFRADRLGEMDVVLGPPAIGLRVTLDLDADAAARSRRKAWLGV